MIENAIKSKTPAGIATMGEGEADEQATTQVTIHATVPVIEWTMFKNLPMMSDQQKQEYLSMIVSNALEEILYNNPKLLMSYCRANGGRHS